MRYGTFNLVLVSTIIALCAMFSYVSYCGYMKGFNGMKERFRMVKELLNQLLNLLFGQDKGE